jgi:hypothetical protein
MLWSSFGPWFFLLLAYRDEGLRRGDGRDEIQASCLFTKAIEWYLLIILGRIALISFFNRTEWQWRATVGPEVSGRLQIKYKI